jgi:hypothetical protein
MRRTLLVVLTALLWAAGAQLRAADDEMKALIAKAIKAHGGEATLAKYQASQSKNKGKVKVPGVGEVEFTQSLSTMQPNKFKDVVELAIANQKITITTLVNGDKMSIEAAGMEIKLTDALKTALKDAQHVLKVASVLPLARDKGYELAPLGEAKVEGKPAVGVRVSSKGHKDVNLYFYKDTGLLAKLEYRSADPMSDKEFTEERIILEYGPKGPEGMPVPKKALVKRDGENYAEAEVVEAKYLEKLDDSEFAK